MLRIWCAQLNPLMGDVTHNTRLIEAAWQAGKAADAQLVVCPELAICGYPPEDLLLKEDFLSACTSAIHKLAQLTATGPALLVGAPWRAEGYLFNTALLLKDGRVDTIATKRELPNYGVFDERRYFTPGPGVTTGMVGGVRLGLAVCEDLWYPTVAKGLKEIGAEAIIAINASPYEMDKASTRHEIIRHRVCEVELPILYLNQVGGQDELVFDGHSFTFNPGAQAPAQQLSGFRPDSAVVTLSATEHGYRFEAPTPQAVQPIQPANRLQDVYHALCLGVQDYVGKNGFKGVVVGLSGGIDSALVAAIAVDALGAENVVGLLMPSPYSSDHSIADATLLAKNLGIKTHTIPIQPGMTAFDTMLADIFTGTTPDTTEENLQARLRGMLLMAYSNKFGHMLLSTGNKSEMSVGYATLYGDMNGGFNPLKDVYKTTVFALCRWLNESRDVIPTHIITKPPSAELKPDQQDSDSLPPYDVLDSILQQVIEQRLGATAIIANGHDGATVRRIIKMLRRAEYKRRQAPPGVKITSIAFGKDFRFPITNHWLDEEQA